MLHEYYSANLYPSSGWDLLNYGNKTDPRASINQNFPISSQASYEALFGLLHMVQEI